MIEPTEKDIGRRVVYLAWPGGAKEYGVVKSYSPGGFVFVLYDGDTEAKATSPSALKWMEAEQ